jgi:hypothetical protein
VNVLPPSGRRTRNLFRFCRLTRDGLKFWSLQTPPTVGGARPLPNKLVWKTWNTVLAEMELPTGEAGFRPYDLKKTALRALRRAGIPEERAMYFSGHSTSSTFRRYDITARDDNRQDMKSATEYRRKKFADKEGSDADKAAKLLRIQP